MFVVLLIFLLFPDMHLVAVVVCFGTALDQELALFAIGVQLSFAWKQDLGFFREVVWIFRAVHYWLTQRPQRVVFGSLDYQRLFVNHVMGLPQRIEPHFPGFKFFWRFWRNWELVIIKVSKWSHRWRVKIQIWQSRLLGLLRFQLGSIHRISLHRIEQSYLEFSLR